VAKDVSREQRYFEFGDAVDSLALCPIKRRKSSVSLASQSAFDNLFVPRSNVYSIPAARTGIGTGSVMKTSPCQTNIVGKTTCRTTFHTTSPHHHF
jgi:hypothetical protein